MGAERFHARRAVIGYLDCSTGVSGDKFLGALLDVGAHDDRFGERDLQAILDVLAPEARVRVTVASSHGVSARGVSVSATSEPPHRHWSDLRTTLEGAALDPAVRADALRVFEALAHAEAAAHGCDIDKVHFHEVGAIDSILDIVGVCAGLRAVGIDQLVVSPVAVGSGTVSTSHGILPVPAPATARLLSGVPVHQGPHSDNGPMGELTTPTGAALVSALATQFGWMPAMTPFATGFGTGTRDIGMPNVCMLVVGEPAPAIALDEVDIAVLETTVDHLSGEAAAHAIAQVLAQGARDAWCTPLTMKKGRPGLLLTAVVLDEGETVDLTAQRIVALTGTLGVRVTRISRYEAKRRCERVPTPWGEIGVKVGPEGAHPRVRPESDDVVRIAGMLGEPFAYVRSELETLARAHLGL